MYGPQKAVDGNRSIYWATMGAVPNVHTTRSMENEFSPALSKTEKRNLEYYLSGRNWRTQFYSDV